MKIYSLLIIGHSDFSIGIKKFLEFFGISEKKINYFYLDNENNQDKLRKNLEDFYFKNPQTITFADLSGGSPHKTAMEVISSLGNGEHHLVAGVMTSVILETALKTTTIGIKGDVLVDNIIPSINFAMKNIVCSTNDKIIPCVKKEEEQIIDNIGEI